MLNIIWSTSDVYINSESYHYFPYVQSVTSAIYRTQLTKMTTVHALKHHGSKCPVADPGVFVTGASTLVVLEAGLFLKTCPHSGDTF